MSLKEEFLKISTYEEFDKQRKKFKGLKWDKEVAQHYDFLFGECYVGDIENGVIEELYPKEYLEKRTWK